MSSEVSRNSEHLFAGKWLRQAPRMTTYNGDIRYKSNLTMNFVTKSILISVQQAPPVNALDYSPITLNSVYK
jgi:hypothetical protein